MQYHDYMPVEGRTGHARCSGLTNGTGVRTLRTGIESNLLSTPHPIVRMKEGLGDLQRVGAGLEGARIVFLEPPHGPPGACGRPP